MNNGFLSVLLLVGLIWARSSLGKIIGGKFAESLGSVLTKNAQSNPFPVYKQFLESFAIPNSQIFGQLTMWGEFLTAVSITGGSLYLLFKNPNHRLAYIVLIAGLVGGIFLNINFWFAFSWTSPANDSLNLLMIFIQLIGVVTLVKMLKVLKAK